MKLLEALDARQSGSMTEDLATDGAEELKLILEVVDILDELNILMFLFEKQVGVVSDVQRQCSSVKPRKKQKDHEPSPTINIRHVEGDLTINSGSFQTLGDLNLEATSLGGYAGELMGKAAHRLQAEKAGTARIHSEVKQTHELVSCPGSRFIMIRRIAHHATYSSWGCWTSSRGQPVSKRPVSRPSRGKPSCFLQSSPLYLSVNPQPWSLFLLSQLTRVAPSILLHFLLWAECGGVYWGRQEPQGQRGLESRRLVDPPPPEEFTYHLE